VHARKVALSDDVDLAVIARGTPGLSGAELANLLNEGALLAARRAKKKVDMHDIEDAREKVQFGRERRRIMDDEDKKIVAYHEAGHAYAAVKLLRKQRLTKVTIIRHGNALGFAAWKPQEEIYTSSKEELRNRLQIALGSRAAEELFLDIQMSGVTGDLQSATSIAAYMVGAYGMDNSFYSYLAFGPEAMRSGELKKQIEAILAEEYRRVKHLLDQNREAVIAIAEALILRNELTDIDVNDILARIEATHPYHNTPLTESTSLPNVPSEVVIDSSVATPSSIPTTPMPDGSTAFRREPLE
jgi:ATP-dependent Zn protease